MNKRIISMLLVLMLLLGMLPTSAFATEATDPAETVETTAPVETEDAAVISETDETTVPEETEETAAASGTLLFSTDLKPDYLNAQSQLGSTSLKVAVGTYTAADGTETALPDGTVVTYQWYSSTDGVIDDGDTKVGTGTNYNASLRDIGITYYYVVATAAIEDTAYTGTSMVACFKVGAANITVTFTVNNKGVLAADKDGAAVAGKTVTVQDLNADGTHTYDEALQAAHTSLLTADDYVTTMTDYGMSVTKLWGVETSNCLFYLNNAALTTNVGETTVVKGDTLYASINKDDKYYSDKFTAFASASLTTTVGLENDLTLVDIDDNALSGMTIGTWEDGAFVAMEGVTTDENGKIKLTFDEAGTYIITATGTIRDTVTDYSNWPETSEVEFDCPIMVPGCAITVKDRGEVKFSGEFTSIVQNYSVGEKPRFSSLLSVGYYIGGSRDYSAKITTTWYRINAFGNGVAEQVENINAAFTTEDIGTWQYYKYAECEIYGVKYTARTNFLNVVISDASTIEGSDTNEFVTGMTYQAGYLNNVDIGYEPGKTEYTIIHYDSGSNDTIKATPVPGKGLWYGYRIDGIRDSSGSYGSSDKELNLTTYNTVSVSLPTTLKAGSTNMITLIVGTKTDTDGNGAVNSDDDFDVYNAYNFTVLTLPSLSSLTVKDSEGSTVKLDKTVSSYGAYWASDVYGNTDAETVKLTAAFKASDGVKLYIGDSETPYTANLSDMEVTLADYMDEDSVANIPLKLVSENGVAEHTVNIHLSPVPDSTEGDFDPPVITTQPAAESTVEKDSTVALTVVAQEPAEGELSYQWYTGSSYYLGALDRLSSTALIEGATSVTYDAPAQVRVGAYTKDQYYACVVTLTIDGKTVSILSDIAKVTTLLTYVNTPEITVQPGLGAAKDGSGIYKTEYVAGSKFDPMWMAVQSDNVKVDGVYVYVTEYGCDPFTVTGYYSATPYGEDAISFTGVQTTSYSGGTFGRFFSFTPDVGLPEGEWYVWFEVTSTATDDPSKTASVLTDCVKLTYTAPEFSFEGSGTEEDPYLLKTGEDFVEIQQNVEAGINFSGIYLKMANDITLPEDWVSIGSNGANGLHFSGILDGGGYTLSFAKGSDGLIYHAKGAEIKNLKIYGEEIQTPALISSSWINQTSGAWIAKVDNVTLVSGTSTLGTGLVAGSGSTYNPIYLSNCYAEEGVIIGYDKTKSGIGTFAGGFIGTITNCHSAATIYGVDRIGGILSGSSNSMGAGRITNCSFTGKIEATGSNIGGIIGYGYNSNSAPNALCVSIMNCYVIAEISGKSNVGGLLGADAGVQQAWENGPGYIRDNVFYGTLIGETNVGALVGYYAALNKYNIIENNYYYDINGCDTPIGGVEHIDTSTHEFGMGDDGIFYYDTSRDSLEDIKEFVDAEDKGTSEWGYTSVSKTNHNRNDDPMGADKEKLGKSCTPEEMTDGTVLKLLNESETSQKNWIQGEKCPIIDNAPIVTALAISGEYKDEYYIGEELDLTGAVFTVTWSDGTTTTVALEDVTVTGFDSAERASLILTASYQGASCEFVVKVIKKPVEEDVNSITVSFILMGDDIHFDEDGTENLTGEIHTLTANNLDVWIEETTYTVGLNATVWDVIQKALEGNNMTCKYTSSLNTVYIQSVTYGDLTLGEFDNGSNSGWMYTLNGKHPLLGVAQQYLEDGDAIIFHYTDDYTQEKDPSDSIKVNVTISNAGEVVMAQEAISVADLNGDGKFNVDEALYAAHEAGYTGGAAEGYGSAETAWGLSITKLWGDTSGCYGYWLNNASCWSLADEVAEGDHLTAFVYSDKTGWSDAYAWFDSFDYTAASELTVTVQKSGYDASYNTVVSRVTGAAITAYDAGGNAVDTGKYSVRDNGDGSYTITFTEDGVYTLIATETTTPIVPAVCKVSIRSLPFVDVPENTWYRDAVEFVYWEGIMNGVETDTFDPYGTLTRAQFVTILYRMAGTPAISGASAFTDVLEGRYYTDAVIWATENGITKGIGNDLFDPYAAVTRQQMVTFLYRYAQYTGADVSEKADLSGYTDADSVSGYAREAMAWAVGNEIILGVSQTQLDPRATATRAQAAKVVQRLYSVLQ